MPPLCRSAAGSVVGHTVEGGMLKGGVMLMLFLKNTVELIILFSDLLNNGVWRYFIIYIMYKLRTSLLKAKFRFLDRMYKN